MHRKEDIQLINQHRLAVGRDPFENQMTDKEIDHHLKLIEKHAPKGVDPWHKQASNKFTFKTEKPTGKWRSFQNSQHYIKIKKYQVGQIIENTRGLSAYGNQSIKVRFQVIKADINEDGNTNYNWKWITLAREFKSVDEAKEWLNSEDTFEKLNKQFNFYKHQD